MGLTLQDAERLGFGPEHPDHPSRRQPKRKVPKVNALGQNKTESDFDRLLADLKHAGRIKDFRFEPVKIRLAGQTSLRIDFLVLRRDRTVAAVEIKGYWREDAKVKTKVAPEVCPFFDYYVAFRDGLRGWDVRPVDRKGIGRHSDYVWYDPKPL